MHKEVLMEEPRRRGPGRPKGSKNKPKPTGKQRSEVRADRFTSAEDAIVENLPNLMDVLIKAAVEDGDTNTAKYLIDRLLGRATERKEISGGEQRIVIETKEDWRN